MQDEKWMLKWVLKAEGFGFFPYDVNFLKKIADGSKLV